jgi:natural product precursor
MKKLSKLKLNKEVISSLEQSHLTGGYFSEGCSDGCLTTVAHTYILNCSNGNCTFDCNCR